MVGYILATAAFVGYTVVEVAQTEDGRVDVADLASKLGDEVEVPEGLK